MALLDPIVSVLALAAIVLAAGCALGLWHRDRFSFRWLAVAAALIIVNDVALTNAYWELPNVIAAGSHWNWQSKALALLVTLLVAAHPAFGWRRVGLTLAQNTEGRPLTYAVTAVVCIAFAAMAIMLPDEPLDGDRLAFQSTMPGLEEEPFFRGILLLALNEAFRGRIRMLGVRLGWGALLSCVVFGLEHALEYHDGAFSCDAMTMLVTGGPSFILVWMRERTGSLVLLILLHNYANTIPLFL